MNLNQWLLARREGRLAALPLGMNVAMVSSCNVLCPSPFNGDGYDNFDGNGNEDENGNEHERSKGNGNGDGDTFGIGNGNQHARDEDVYSDGPSVIQGFYFKDKS